MADNKLELVKKLRERTGSGMADCNKALAESNNDVEAAVDWLRKKGIAKADSKSDRVTNAARIGYAMNDKFISIIEVRCETDFVAKNDQFGEKITELTRYALDRKSSSVEQFLKGPLPEGQKGGGEAQTMDYYVKELFAPIGEKVEVSQVKLLEIPAGSTAGVYLHSHGISPSGAIAAVIIEGSAKDPSFARQLALHIVGTHPEYLDQEEVPKEAIDREIAITLEKNADKSDDAKAKMVKGAAKKYYAAKALAQQEYLFDSSKSVGDFAKDQGVKLKSFFHIKAGE